MSRDRITKLCGSIALCLAVSSPAWSDSTDAGSGPGERARLSAGGLHQVQVSPISLNGGSTLTIISPSKWGAISRKLQEKLEEVHRNYTSLFGGIPAFTISLRLLEEEEFYRMTGAPRWTNAMYYRKQILIPLSEENVDLRNLLRSLTHEYTHAVIHSLSGGKAPGWLDEGLAQWAEGDENPALRPALINWLKRSKPVPLSLLQGGFTKLENEMVPAAYAQSIFAAKHVLDEYGIDAIKAYFERLRVGDSKRDAFEAAFGISEKAFEKKLDEELGSWLAKELSQYRRSA